MTDIIPITAKYDIDGFLSKRQEFIEKVNNICVEGRDYHVVKGKKSLAKGGAEKIASIFTWTAQFEKDTDTLSMLGDQKGLVAYKCTLVNGQFVGEGRGAATLSKNEGDPNKTIKMAQKSAFIDAVLRASGLSDFFTQDLDHESEGSKYGHLEKQEKNENQGRKPTEKQKAFIEKLCREKGISQAELLTIAKEAGSPSATIDKLLNTQPKKNDIDQIIEDIPF